MLQWVGHGTQNIGNNVNNNDQGANHHHAGRDRRVILLANGVDHPASKARPAENHLGDHRQRQHG